MSEDVLKKRVKETLNKLDALDGLAEEVRNITDGAREPAQKLIHDLHSEVTRLKSRVDELEKLRKAVGIYVDKMDDYLDNKSGEVEEELSVKVDCAYDVMVEKYRATKEPE